MIHLYAFAHGLSAPPAANGLRGAPLERVDVDGIAAIYSRHEGDGLAEATRDLALAHGSVISAVDASAEAVLPVRFGERFGEVADLRAAVRARRSALEASLARVAGCAEIGLRVLGSEPEHEPAATGTEYMQRLRAAGTGPAPALHRALEALSRDVRISPRAGHLLSASYLVPRDRLDEVRHVVETWTAEHRDIPVICTGPWAPFTFATEAV